MGCGCQSKSFRSLPITSQLPTEARPQLSNAPTSRAAMCQTCPNAQRNKLGGATRCKIDGKSIVYLTTRENVCPIGRHPDAAGRVRWLGVEWLGVPEPLRWLLTWQLKREPRNLDGCGCIKAVKESRIGPWVEPWFEGIALLRKRFGEFLTEFQVAMRGV